MSDPQLPSDHSANLRGLLLNPTAADDRALLEPPTPEELQAALPGYEVSKMVGRGGMGAVYLGRQISLDRKVAVKVLPPHLEGDDGNFVERFKNEARAMARLNHPGIVAVYDFGQTDAGLLYFVMEFVEGTDVQRMISQQKRLKSAHAHAITAHVCDALAYAHERGLIHRDIKPANIMLSQEGEVKVADFGLAKAMNTNATNLTQSGMVLGTLHYMAPESFILGAAVDHRADLYAVGVMLYQMLTGRVPSGVFELPSLQIPGLDPRFDDIITRAMREEREDRYQSAVEMRHDLDGMLTQPVPVKNMPPEAAATKVLPKAIHSNSLQKRHPAQAPEQESFKLAKKSTVLGWVLATLLLLAGCGAYLWLTGVRVTFDEETTPAPLPPVVVQPPKTSMPELEPEPKAAEVKIASVPPSTKPASTPPKPSVPQTPPAQPQGNVIDLLALPDVAKGALSGQWALAGTALEVRAESTDSRSYDLVFPWSVRTLDEYDFEISFTLTASAVGAITMHLPTTRRRVLYYLQSYPSSKIQYGFNGLDGKRILDNPAASSALDLPLRPGIRHSAKVEVRSGSLRAFMNGKKIVDWSGDLRRFAGDENFKYDQRSPALGVYGGGVIFHKAVITERATQPAAAVAQTPPPVAPATLDFPEYQQLLQTHATDWQQHVRQPYDDSMALLSSQFIQALERGMITSDPKKKGAFADELQRFKAAAQPPPASGDADPFLPAQIPQFRQAFRLQAARLQQARDLAAAGVTKEFLDALDALEKQQAASQQLGRAAGVKALHADLLAGKKAVAEVLIAKTPVVTTQPATAPSTTAAAQFTPPDGTLKTGGQLVFQDDFDSGVLSADWKQQNKAWYCVTGLLGTTEAYLKDAKDNGWGCWLGRDLPEYVRIEFDIDFVGRGAVMVCELYATPPKGAASPAGTGYKLMFGEKGAARPVIQRGMTPLVSGGLNTNPVTASASTIHHIAIQRVDGQTLEWFIDGRLHARARDGDPKRGGWLGFQYEDGMVLVDNVRVFDLDPRSQAAASAAPVAVTPPVTPATVTPAPTAPAITLSGALVLRQQREKDFDAVGDLAGMAAFAGQEATKRNTKRALLLVQVSTPGMADGRRTVCFAPQDVRLNKQGLGYAFLWSDKSTGVLNVVRPGYEIATEGFRTSGGRPTEVVVTLSPLTPARACIIRGQVRNPDKQPAAQVIVRLADWAVTRTDGLGRYFFQDVSPGTHLLRAESAQGEVETSIALQPGVNQEQNLQIEKADMLGLRWTLQTEPENPLLTGPGTVNGEAFLSGSFDVRRGTHTHDQSNDFSFFKTTGVLRCGHSDGINGLHLETLPFEQIHAINLGQVFEDHEYFQNGTAKNELLRPGHVFTLRSILHDCYAKLEITHVPAK